MKTENRSNKRGAVIVIVMVVLVAFTLFVSAALQLAGYNGRETEQQVRDAQAFWLAEAGLQNTLADLDPLVGGNGNVSGEITTFNAATGRAGRYDVVAVGPDAYISTGSLTVGGITTVRSIRFETKQVDQSYNEAVSGLNRSGAPWIFLLGGVGDPVRSGGFPSIPGPGDTEVGGADEVWGDVYTGEDGDIWMGGDSSINPAISPNTYNFGGDANTSGGTVLMDTNGNPHISGDIYEDVPVRTPPDLLAMDYPNTATHNLTEIFDDALGEGVSGTLPWGHPLRNVVRRSGDDYYFEPRSGSGSSWDLDLGRERVYYADGDIWFDQNGPYQFDIDGTVTIVASGNIHIGDGLRYQSDDDIVALVALGEYDEQGTLRDNTGNIYFGDPRFGTVYEMDAFMMAANNFYYNLEENPFSNNTPPKEPDTGFIVFGNFVALNQIHVYRDWYDPEDGGDARPAVLIPGEGWVDALDFIQSNGADKNFLSDQEINGAEGQGHWEGKGKKKKWVWDIPKLDPMRHYRLIVKYDERIHDPSTHPPGLPKSSGSTGGESADVVKWQHYDEG